MKRIITIMLLSGSLFSFSQQQSDLKTTINKVTVFKNGAQINRQGQVFLTKGRNLVKIGQLTSNLEPNSIQVSGKGNFTIISVNHEYDFLSQVQTKEEIKKLEESKIQLEQEIKKQNASKLAYNKELSVLDLNSRIGSDEKGTNITDLQTASKFFLTRTKAIQLALIDIEKAISEMGIEKEKIEKQLLELNQSNDESVCNVIIELEAEADATADLILSYVVNNAGWIPFYDIRVDDLNHPVNFDFKAKVYQNSGEDWNDVQLTISNSDPNVSNIKPELNPWYLRNSKPNPYFSKSGGTVGAVAKPLITKPVLPKEGYLVGIIYDSESGEPIPFANVILESNSGELITGVVSDFNGQFAVKKSPDAALIKASYVGYETNSRFITRSSVVYLPMQASTQSIDEVVVTSLGISKKYKELEDKEINIQVDESPTHISYIIEEPYTILSNANEYTVKLKKLDVSANYTYYTVPKLSTDAYLVAEIPNWENYNFIEGEANIFYEGMYIGKTYLNLENFSDTLNLSIGRDEKIIVNREKVKDISGTQLIGPNKKQQIAYRIKIRNTRSEKVNIIIQDQIPLTNMDDVEIDLIEKSGANLNAETGILQWKSEINPSKTEEIIFKYALKYPKKYNLK